MPEILEEIETSTEVGDGDIICQAYDDGPGGSHIPCRSPATTWIEILPPSERLIPVCDHHAEEWSRWAPAAKYLNKDWRLLPMR